MEAVFVESVIGIAVAEIDGRILEVNRALCEMLGFTAAEITGRTFWEFVHPFFLWAYQSAKSAYCCAT